jgi:ureidoacrylate peracid hydrolase
MQLEDTAFIIIDMQNDFIHEKGFVIRSSQGVNLPQGSLERLRAPIPNILKLADFFRRNHKHVIHVYTDWAPDYSDLAIPLGKTADRAKKEGVLVRGSWGAQIIDELKPLETDHQVVKKAYGAFFQTSLDRVLRNLAIRTIVLTGVATNYCVETTAREAVAYGYEVIFVSDGTASFDPEGHEATLKVIAAGFGDVKKTQEIVE